MKILQSCYCPTLWWKQSFGKHLQFLIHVCDIAEFLNLIVIIFQFTVWILINRFWKMEMNLHVYSYYSAFTLDLFGTLPWVKLSRPKHFEKDDPKTTFIALHFWQIYVR